MENITQKIIWISILAFGLIVVVSYLMPQFSNTPTTQTTKHKEVESAKIPLDQLVNGCSRRDCIPSIDNPIFENTTTANQWLNNTDRVFVLTHKNQTKIYPQRIINWHEIVNDSYDEDAIAVTFCPLCGTATAFERKVNGIITQFGVSGKLHDSDLVMYDRLEGSLWQQISGEAILGPAARRSEILEPLFLITLSWGEAMEKYPQAQILSRETGFSRNYDAYPYGTYEENGNIFFGVENSDDRLHPKAWVYGIKVDGIPKAFPEEKIFKTLAAGQKTTQQINNAEIEIFNNDGVITFTNITTGKKIIPLRSFWFAWATFNPETEIY